MIDRRKFLAVSAGVVLTKCAAIGKSNMGTVKLSGRFRIDGGDGDQSYFSAPLNMVLADASWFPYEVPEFGEALLFTIDGGLHDGEYIVVTARGGG